MIPTSPTPLGAVFGIPTFMFHMTGPGGYLEITEPTLKFQVIIILNNNYM